MSKRDPIREQAWIEKLENFRVSGLTIPKWCEQNGEKLHTFKYWKARLKERNTQPMEFEEIKHRLENEGVKIVCKEISIQLQNGSDEQMLKTLVKAIQGC